MRKLQSTWMMLLLAVAVSASSSLVSAAEKEKTPEPRVIAYYTAWSVYGRKFFPNSIPAEKLTHVNYAFANISGGEIVIGDPFADIQKKYPGDWAKDKFHGNLHQLSNLKKKHRHLKTFISVGGWTWSSQFSGVAATDASRKKFAISCARFVSKYDFNGLDIDWEYPVAGGKTEGTPADTVNFTLLLKELRHQLDIQGKKDGERYMLTIAAPAGPEKISHIEVEKIHQYLDWIAVMVYDFHGGWDAKTGFVAPLYAPKDSPDAKDATWNVDAAMQTYVKRGVPRNKLVMGIGFYGRAWKGVPDKNHGMYQTHTGMPKGSWEAGVFDYKHLRRDHTKRFTRYWHKDAQVPWLYDKETGVCISYEDIESVTKKVEYTVKNRFGGIMIWELTQDTKDWELLTTINRVLREKPATSESENK